MLCKEFTVCCYGLVPGSWAGVPRLLKRITIGQREQRRHENPYARLTTDKFTEEDRPRSGNGSTLEETCLRQRVTPPTSRPRAALSTS